MGSPLPEVPARAPTSAEVKSYVRTTVDNARRQLEAMLNEVEAAAPPSAEEEPPAGAAAAAAGRPGSAAAGKPGAGADTLERPADEGTFLLHAAVGVLDFLQHRLNAGRKGFPRTISLAGRSGVEETPKSTGRSHGSRAARPVTLPPIVKRKAAAAAPLPVVAAMSDPAAAVFQGHGREAAALATLPAEPPLVSQPSAATRVGAEMEIAGFSPSSRGLMGQLRGDVRPWGKKTANVPLR
jgi:hypothetical protein